MWQQIVHKVKSVLALIILPVFSGVFAAEANTAEYYLKLVDSKGAEYVVRNELGSWEQWVYFLDQVSTGGKDWIHLAKKLRPKTDAGKSLSLEIAMAQALPHNPVEVVSTINIHFKLGSTCGFPFIEPDQEFLETHYANSMLALDKAQEKSDFPQLKRCQKELIDQYNRFVKK